MMHKSCRAALALIVSAVAVLAANVAVAQPFMLNDMCNVWPNGPQPRPRFSTIDRTDPNFSRARTGLFPQSALVDPTPVPGADLAAEGGHLYPPGDSFGDDPKNLLPTVYADARTCLGDPILNTLPSTPERPYNLHVEDPLSEQPVAIEPTSPTDDLDKIRRHLLDATRGFARRDIDGALLQRGIDILEGNPVPGRAYSGFPLLHYIGPLKVKAVDPATRTVVINQIWYDTHIESDTAYIDTSTIEKLPDGSWDDGEWYVRYNVHVLNRGHEDFASFPMLFEDPKTFEALGMPVNFIPNISLDQTFFPMEEGLKYTFTIKQSPARFLNLTYHWGWRLHPPRVQAHENLLRGFVVPNPDFDPAEPAGPGNPETIAVLRDHFEREVFGENPRASEEAKLAAIAMIGDLAPAKRMWNALRALKDDQRRGGPDWRRRTERALADEFSASFFDWSDRTRLPRGIPQDPDADVTIAYMNNTIYGDLRGRVRDGQVELAKWTDRGTKVHVAILNADYFPHQYTLVDFGGMRGWENTFQNTIPVGGAGAWFTFGRIHWWPHTVQPPAAAGGSAPIVVGPAARPAESAEFASYAMDRFRRIDRGEKMLPRPGRRHGPAKVIGNDLPNEILGTADGKSSILGRHDIEWEFTYEPGRRLRMYQFDAFHHDVAVWSIH